MAEDKMGDMVAKHKKIFSGREGCPSIGDGWIPLVDNLCGRLQKLTDNYPDKHPQVIATQVKEKFSTLRFYIEDGSPEQHEVIHFAEQLSGSICEHCSSMKNVGHTLGWFHTVCKNCYETVDFYKEYKEWVPNK